ncbi:hypothetical protein ACWEKJ_39940 [Amycolatopsis thermoflava]
MLTAEEFADFDTHLPHWFGNADERAVEFLSILGPKANASTSRRGYRRD